MEGWKGRNLSCKWHRYLLEYGWYVHRASVELFPSSQLPESGYCLQVTSLRLTKNFANSSNKHFQETGLVDLLCLLTFLLQHVDKYYYIPVGSWTYCCFPCIHCSWKARTLQRQSYSTNEGNLLHKLLRPRMIITTDMTPVNTWFWLFTLGFLQTGSSSLGLHICSHSFLVSNLLPLPRHPPYWNCLKCRLVYTMIRWISRYRQLLNWAS